MSNPDVESFLSKLERIITNKYYGFVRKTDRMLCKQSENREIGSIKKPVFHLNMHSIKQAYLEIATDVRFILERRGPRIGASRPSPGKIAGIMVYRLSRSHIVHLFEGCAACKNQCASMLNYEFAVKCAWEYIAIEYSCVPLEVKKELLYSLTLRHVNQETLGLVFDTILHLTPHTNIS